MHRYEELEKIYYKRLYKKTLFFFLGFILLLASLFGVYYLNVFVLNKKESEKIIKNKKVENKKPLPKTLPKTTKKKDLKKTKQESLSPDLSFLSNMKLSSPKINKKTKKVKKTVKKTKKQVKKSTPNISLKVKTVGIKDLINVYNKNPTYQNAILIAKRYLEMNNLNKAQEWALKANGINPSNYQSWKLFALILLKKNDKIKAKKVLNIYLKDYGYNEQINKLLRSIDE